MKKLILRLLLLTLLSQIPSAFAADKPDNAAKIDKFMAQYADCCSFTGTVLVADHDQVIFTNVPSIGSATCSLKRAGMPTPLLSSG